MYVAQDLLALNTPEWLHLSFVYVFRLPPVDLSVSVLLPIPSPATHIRDVECGLHGLGGAWPIPVLCYLVCMVAAAERWGLHSCMWLVALHFALKRGNFLCCTCLLPLAVAVLKVNGRHNVSKHAIQAAAMVNCQW
jgi:hypothetical protein